MATIGLRALQVYSPNGVIHLPEAASQTFKKGQLLTVASNAVAAAVADAVQLVVAAEDATGTTGNKVACYKVGSTTQFEISVLTTGAAAVGVAYGFSVASGVNQIDTTDTVNKRFKVTEINLAPATEFGIVGTDTNARVRAQPVLQTAGVDATTVAVGVGDTTSIWF